MSITKDTLSRLLAILLPPACLSCGRVEGYQSLPLALCGPCRGLLVELPAATNNGRRPPGSALDACSSLWSYEPPFDVVIHALKFSRLEFLGEDLAAALHHQAREVEGESDVVVPIPLHWRRRLQRGYNQAESIARPLAERLGLPLVRALRRRRATRAQARLARKARELNLRLAFTARETERPRIAGRRVLLVDDVVTTGATLEAAARCLRRQGAEEIRALTAGRTPMPRRAPRSDVCKAALTGVL